MYSCRQLLLSDLETVMTFRMQPHVTKYMNTDPALTLDGQVSWYNKMKASGIFYYWAIEVESVPCGVINLGNVDLINMRSDWGYYIADKSLRSLHLCVSLEMSLYDFAFDVLGLNKVYGESFSINHAAVKMHELCGCETDGILRQHIFKDDKFYDVTVQSMLADRWRELRSSFDYEKIAFPVKE